MLYLSQLSSYLRGHVETLSYPPTRVIPLNYHASHTRVHVTRFGDLETKGDTVRLCIESVRFATKLPEQRERRLTHLDTVLRVVQGTIQKRSRVPKRNDRKNQEVIKIAGGAGFLLVFGPPPRRGARVRACVPACLKSLSRAA